LPLGAQAQQQAPLAPVAAAHTIATPTEVPSPSAPSFALEGFTLPDGCIAIADKCAPSVASAPMFEAETEKYRPLVNISFVAGDDGRCGVGEVETVDGKTKIIPTLAGVVSTKKGERTYVGAVFYDAQERHSAGIDETQAYRFAVMCRSTDGSMHWSSFYEAPRAQGT
jgi:hypothetical protein